MSMRPTTFIWVCVILLSFCREVVWGASLLGADGATTCHAGLRPGMKASQPPTDAELFDAIDLDLPGLERVKVSAANGDWKGARCELYSYLRDKFRRANYYTPLRIVGRKTVRDDDWMHWGLIEWTIEHGRNVHGLEDPLKALEVVADDLARRGTIVFHSTGRSYRFNPARPFDFIDFDPAGREYHEPMQLYAFYDLALLRDQFFRTGRRLYLDRAKEMMGSYCAWYLGGAASEIAIKERTNFLHPWENWTLPRRLWAYLRFMTLLQKTDIEPDLVVDVMKCILEDERLHVSRGPLWGGNWRQFMCTDGATIAAVFFEFKQAGQWFDDQVSRLVAGSTDLMPDGSMSDLSTSYAEGYVIWMPTLHHLIKAFGSPLQIKIPPEAAARYEKVIDWQLAMRKPGGHGDAQFNDNGETQPASYFGRLAGDLFDYFGRQDLRWFATEGQEGVPPNHASFPPTSTSPNYGGMIVMRSDWSDSARWLVADFGPLGGHHHPDYGSFILHAYGADLIEEGGCAAYGSEAWQKYSLQPWAHNIIGIDGVTQPADRPAWGKPLDNWITNPAFDYVWGRSSFEIADKKLKGVIHRRAIYFAKPDYFLLMDAIDGDGVHRIRSKLQLAWDVSAEVRGNAVEARSRRGAFLRIVPLDNRSAPRVVTAQKEPFWEGWMSRVPHSNEVVPAPAVVYEEDRRLPTLYVALLYPVAQGGTPKIDVSAIYPDGGRGGGRLLTVTSSDRSYRDEFVVAQGPGAVRLAERGILIQGTFVHLRHQSQRLTRIAFIATSLINIPINGSPTTIRFERPTDGFIELDREGTLRRANVYLDLSNRSKSGRVMVDFAGGGSTSTAAELGRSTPLQ